MIIIFNGDTLALLERLQQFSGKSQKVTLDFMLENFRIPSKTVENDAVGIPCGDDGQLI